MSKSQDSSADTIFLNKMRGLEDLDSGPGVPLATDLEAQDESYTRIGWTALFYSLAYLCAFSVGWIIDVRNPSLAEPQPRMLWLTIASILFGPFVWWIARRRWIPPRHLGVFSIFYVVLGAFGINIGVWGWESTIPLTVPIIGIPWVCVWILVIPSVLPAARRGTFVAGLLCALTLPAVALLSVRVHGVPPESMQDVRRIVMSLTVPAIISAGVAHWVSLLVHRLQQDAARLRRMGSYQLVERIGAGGMGEVWRAKHRLLVRPAAIKLIREDVLGKDASARSLAVRRFEREAQATAALSSPHTIELHDFGATAEGTFYFVMELLDGVDLRTLVEEFGPVPPERAVYLLRQVCHSLSDAHALGMVHRDIKPANIFACHRGQEFDFVKVLDFGLVAAAQWNDRAATQLTADGIVAGTPAFMAPEMVAGEPKVGPQVDIYSLGCVAYWLLTGQLVFDGRSPMAILLQHAKDPPPRPSSQAPHRIPAELDELVLACLEKEPSSRPNSSRDLSARLAQIAAQLPAWTSDEAEAWWRKHRTFHGAETKVATSGIFSR